MTITKQQFDAAVEAEMTVKPCRHKDAFELLSALRDRLFPATGYTYDPAKPDRIVVDGREYEITEQVVMQNVWLADTVCVTVLDGVAAISDNPFVQRTELDVPARESMPEQIVSRVVALIRQHVGGGE